MRPLNEPVLRPGVSSPGGPLIVSSGTGRVIFSRLDLTTGLTSSNAISVLGYQPQYCEDLVQDLIIWAIGKLAK
jgi:hypothetical protein